MHRRAITWLWALLLTVALAPTVRADDIAELIARLETSGARVVHVETGDARLRDGRVTTGVGADGRVEVYVPQGEGLVRTPLRSPGRRMSVAEYRGLIEDIRAAVRDVYGIELKKVYIAGSSSGIPFHDPNTGEVRTFDRKGFGTSDYDGALVSEELFEIVENERPRAVRGKNTGLRTAPDPLPVLRERFMAIEAKYGRHVAGMVYASEAEFTKRLGLTGYELGKNIMPEPPANARGVEATRAEMVGTLVEAKALETLIDSHGAGGARDLLERARSGDASASETLRAARRAATTAVAANTTALDDVDRATLNNERARLEQPSNFSSRRRGPRGPPTPLLASEGELRETFETLRGASLERALERVAELPAAERAAARSATLRLRDTRLEILASNDLVLEFRPETNSVRASTGLLNKLEGVGGPESSPANRIARNKALGLLVAHELAHAGGVRAEAVADAEAVRILRDARGLTRVGGLDRPLTRADVARTVGLFAEGSGSRLSDALYALRNVARYGTPRGRVAAMTRTLEGQPDRLASYRRADGTLNWKRLSADKALHHGAGVAQFALALFLKELAVVVRTGDRARIDEFFDGLMTTDFFVTYGLFSAGAHAGNVAFSRYLARYVRPGFVSGILRTNIVLATGLALPDLVRGHFDGKAFAINVTSLGLSSTAVRAGVVGLKWVLNLEGANAGLLAASRLRRFAKLGGFLYTAAETAVVLYFGEAIAERINEHLDDRAARDAVSDATLAVSDAVRAGQGDGVFEDRLEALTEAHRAYRDHLLKTVGRAEAVYHGRLAKAARNAKVLADRRETMLARLDSYDALRKVIESRHGSVAAYADARARADAKVIEEDLALAMESYENARRAGMKVAYEGRRRDDDYLSSGSLLADPETYSWFRRRGLESEARNLSGNRLQAYEDEIAALEAVLSSVQGDAEKTAAVEAARDRARETLRRERALILDTPASASSEGATGALGGIGD